MIVADTDSSDPGPRRVIELDIPSDVGHIERVVERVQREAKDLHFAQRQVMLNVPVALTEALSNAIRCGNSDDPSKTVHVKVVADADCLVIEVRDQGRGFDLDACTVDVSSDTIEREDGRGLFLMRKLMDRVECVPTQPGNTVRLTLRRA